RLQEFGRLRREHDVAGERNIRSCAGRRAVDGADDRFRKPAKGADQRIVALLDRLAEIWTAFARRDRAIAEILSAAKALAGAGQQHGAALVVLRGAPDGIGER